MDTAAIVSKIREGETKINAGKNRRVGSYTGALTVEIVRAALKGEKFAVSHRDVFIIGSSREFDILIPREGCVPENGLLYKPQGVFAAFEVKRFGAVFGRTDNDNEKKKAEFAITINKLIADIHVNRSIVPIYLTIGESKPWQPVYSEYPDLVYCLSWGKEVNDGEWERLIAFLKSKITAS